MNAGSPLEESPVPPVPPNPFDAYSVGEKPDSCARTVTAVGDDASLAIGDARRSLPS